MGNGGQDVAGDAAADQDGAAGHGPHGSSADGSSADRDGADRASADGSGADGARADRSGTPGAAAPAAGPPRTSPQGSAKPLAEVYDVALLDLDGVVYLGGSPIPSAPPALAKARDQGMRLAFVTNNASRSPSAIAQQLTGLGVTASPEDLVTSAQAAARLLAEKLPAGAAVLVAGGIGLRLALRERGLRPVSSAAEQPVAVVQGYAPDISYSLLAEAALAVHRGAWYVAANADATLPSARGPMPGNGSLVQLVVTATGRHPVVAGKPEPPLHAEAVRRTGARRPLIVGDRLDTDIEGADRAGADSLLVLTGVSDPADAVLAPEHRRPAYLADDLGGLVEAHPEVTADGGGFRCAGWTVRHDGGQLQISGSGQPIDGLRALCAAAWTAGGLSAGQVSDAVGKLGFPDRHRES